MFGIGNKADTPAANGAATGFSFGGNTAQQPAANTGFTFGAKPTTTTTTGFGTTAQPATTRSFSLGGQQSAAPVSNTISFGAKPATTTTGTGLFGATNTPAPATGTTTAGTTTFGASNTAAPASTLGSKPTLGFGTSTAVPATTTVGSIQQPQSTANDEKTFLTKIEESKSKIPQKSKINKLLDGCHLLPTNESLQSNLSFADLNVKITPSLNELCESTNLLNHKLSKAGSDLTRAHYLLSGSGFNIQEAEQFIEDLKKVSKAKRLNKAARSVNARTPASKRNSSINETVLDSYLRDKKQEQILSSIEKSLNDSNTNNPLLLDNASYAQKKDELKSLYGINSVSKGKSNKADDSKKSGLSFFDERISESSITRRSKNAANRKRDLWKTFNNCKINVNPSQPLRNSFKEYAKIVNH